MKLDRRTFIAAGGASVLFPHNVFADIKEHEAALYDAAKKEGEMTWYIAHYTSETAERVGRTFTEKYPGVRVNVIRSTAQVAFQRLAKDLQSQVANCDLFASTDLGHYVHLKEKDLLQPYDPKNAEFVQKEFRKTDPDKLFHTTSATFVTLLYNTSKVKAEEAPKGWRDLLDPKWANQVSVGHPGFSGFVGTWVVQMKKLYGWKYFEDLAKLKPQIGRSIIDTVTMLSSGERSVAAGPGALAHLQASRGNPVGVGYAEEGVVLMASPCGVMKNAKHPNAAKLFIEFLYGPEAAAIVRDEYGTPLRNDVEPRPGVKKFSEMKLIAPSVPEIVKGIPEVTEQWRDLFGI